MESIETSTIAPEPHQVPSLRDRLLYSTWYLEARAVVDEFAAHLATLVNNLEKLIRAGAR
jgi:hypothetical protein